jgi:hypothetical protein
VYPLTTKEFYKRKPNIHVSSKTIDGKFGSQFIMNTEYDIEYVFVIAKKIQKTKQTKNIGGQKIYNE